MEDFVTYDLAVELKEKGFNIPFYFFYRTDDKLLHHAHITNPLVYGEWVDDEVVIAPSVSQVLKWLREEKKIHIEIDFGCYGFCWDLTLNIKYVEGYNNSEWDLLDWEKYKEIDNQGNHSTYEQCALCAIEYILDNLI